MKKFHWEVFLGFFLISLSFSLYFIHYIIFHDIVDIISYIVDDIAFIPIELFIVTVIFNRLLTIRERKDQLRKINLIIGVFFSSAGMELLELFSSHSDAEGIHEIVFKENYDDKGEFMKIKEKIKLFNFNVEYKIDDLKDLRDLLIEKEDFLLSLLENPGLENQTFNDLLWMLLHLREELIYHKDITYITREDFDHVIGEIKRVYSLLINEWLLYMRHLKGNYPQLFSLAMRINPFKRKVLKNKNEIEDTS